MASDRSGLAAVVRTAVREHGEIQSTRSAEGLSLVYTSGSTSPCASIALRMTALNAYSAIAGIKLARKVGVIFVDRLGCDQLDRMGPTD